MFSGTRKTIYLAGYSCYQESSRNTERTLYKTLSWYPFYEERKPVRSDKTFKLIIMKTYLYNLYSKTGVYRGIHYFSYFC